MIACSQVAGRWLWQSRRSQRRRRLAATQQLTCSSAIASLDSSSVNVLYANLRVNRCDTASVSSVCASSELDIVAMQHVTEPAELWAAPQCVDIDQQHLSRLDDQRSSRPLPRTRQIRIMRSDGVTTIVRFHELTYNQDSTRSEFSELITAAVVTHTLPPQLHIIFTHTPT